MKNLFKASGLASAMVGLLGAATPSSGFHRPQWPSDVSISQISMVMVPAAATFDSCNAATFQVAITNNAPLDVPYGVFASKLTVRDASGKEVASTGPVPAFYSSSLDGRLVSHSTFRFVYKVITDANFAASDCPSGRYMATLSLSLAHTSQGLISNAATFVVQRTQSAGP